MQINMVRIKSVVIIITLLTVVCCFTAVSAEEGPRVKTDKDNYAPGEAIKVNFAGAPGSSRDWVCITAAGAPDNDAGDYQYMPNGLTEGIMTFNAPQAGKYEVRAFYNYSRKGYVVSARYSFSVGEAVTVVQRVEKVKVVEGPTAVSISAGPPRINVAVFHFTPKSVDAVNYGTTVTNTLINAPKMQAQFIMLGRRDLEVFLSANGLQQDDQMENIIDIGTKLGMNYVIAGNIARRGTTITTNCKVINIDTRHAIYSKKLTSQGEADLTRHVMKMSDAIIQAIMHDGANQ